MSSIEETAYAAGSFGQRRDFIGSCIELGTPPFRHSPERRMLVALRLQRRSQRAGTLRQRRHLDLHTRFGFGGGRQREGTGATARSEPANQQPQEESDERGAGKGHGFGHLVFPSGFGQRARRAVEIYSLPGAVRDFGTSRIR